MARATQQTPPRPIRKSTASSTTSCSWSMPHEPQLFFDEVLRAGLPLTNFVDSNWTFLNQRLAQHCGGRGRGANCARSGVAGRLRGGALTAASIS